MHTICSARHAIDHLSKRTIPYLQSKEKLRKNEGLKKGGQSLVNRESKVSDRQKIDMGWGRGFWIAVSSL